MSAIREEQYARMSEKEHAKSKAYMTGKFERTEIMQAIDEDMKLYKTKNYHSMALRKIVDEPRANACDVQLKDRDTKHISISFDRSDGLFSVYNDGPGISIDTKILDGKKVYIPEMIFTMFRTGSNLYTTDTHSVAGMNGLGIKLTNIHSKYFKVTTVDAQRKLKYEQEYEDSFDIIHEPHIEKYTKKSFTCVEFIPLYKKFGYSNPPTQEECKEIEDIIRLDMVYLAWFLGEKTNVKFNGKTIPITNSYQFSKLLTDSNNIYNFRSESNEFFVEYSIIVGQHSTKKQGCKDIKSASVVNGCTVKDGTHHTVMRRRINNMIRSLSDQSIDTNSYLTIVSIANIPVDNWGTQSKDTLSVKEEIFKRFSYSDKDIKEVAKKIIDIVKYNEATKKTLGKKADKKIVYDKYVPPTNSKSKATLMVAEGDSALALIKMILASNASEYNISNTGTFSLGGVPQNIAKHVKEMDNGTGNIEEIVDAQFFESKVFGSMINIMKLNPSKTYDTQLEVNKLPFSKIIICVDQDLDGIGNICCLVMQMFYKLWPKLYSMGYVTHWNSPIYRILKNGKILSEMNYDVLFRKFVEEGGLKQGIDVRYIKGLSGHDKKFVPGLAKSFNNNVVTFKVDDDTSNWFSIYYGKDSKKRKVELSTPIEELTEREIAKIERTKSILCNRHLTFHGKSHQLEAISRTLPSLDGFTPVRRKAFATLLKNRKADFMKVFQLAGKTAHEMYYHHGGASMEQAITKMAQNWIGSNIFPLCLGDGIFGTRDKKGKDAGQPRYISVKLNKKLVDSLFLVEDTPILEKGYEDGKEVEPKYYLPVLPLCILETRKAVSYGWQCKVYARDLTAVTKLILKMIKGKEITEEDKVIPPATHGFYGNIEYKEGVIYASGILEHNEDKGIVTITELPTFENPSKYVEKYADHPLVNNIINRSGENDVCIEFYMTPGYTEEIDNLEDFFNIHRTFTEQLNFVNYNGTIQHYDSVYEIVCKTFEYTKNKYIERSYRESLLLKYLIMREENILRFLQSIQKDKSTITKFYGEEDEVIDKYLETDKYDRINNTVLNTHMNYTTSELEVELERNKEYKYIKSIQVGESSKKNVDSRTNKLEELREKLKRLEEGKNDKVFPYSSMYKEEVIEAFETMKEYIN